MKKYGKSAVRRTALRFALVFLLTAALILPTLAIGACRRLPEGGSLSTCGITVTRLGYSRWQISGPGGSVIWNTALSARAESLWKSAGAALRLLLPAAVRRLTSPET